MGRTVKYRLETYSGTIGGYYVVSGRGRNFKRHCHFPTIEEAEAFIAANR